METVADFVIGPAAIDAYSRMSYSMWHALGEFIDNSTQSRTNHGNIIDLVLAQEAKPLVVTITHNRQNKTLTIEDNSIGMTKDRLVAALRIAVPTDDSKGRSRFGMGMKTAACWIGKKWKVITCQWDSGEEWTADVDVKAIAFQAARVPLTMRVVPKEDHYTKIVISDLNRNIQVRTEETIRGYLGSMYRYDLRRGDLKIIYNGVEILAPDEYDFDTDPQGKPMRLDLPEFSINGKQVTGWIGVLRKGKGGRKFGGFSLFQHERQIQGFPNAWKPKVIFGGVDDEGANNLIVQRLTGVLNLDGFQVSHTKDAVLFEGDEEEELENFLAKVSDDYKKYAANRRGEGGSAAPFNKEKFKDLVDAMKSEFVNAEMKDAVSNALLPPPETLEQNNQKLVATLTDQDQMGAFEILPGLTVIVSRKDASEYEPHLTIAAGAEAGVIHVIINGLHPYYASLDSNDAADECLRQYVYDAIAEYRAGRLVSRVSPDSVRRLKDTLLRVPSMRVENAASTLQDSPINLSMPTTPAE